MADSYTPNLNLALVEVGASRDTWGAKLNANTTTLDAYVSQSAPIGMLADFAGPTAPSGWLIADGRLVSRTTYSNLFAVLGTYWGSGDGSTTFALPNLGGRSAVGAGIGTDINGTSLSFAYATMGGAYSNHILQSHLPNYAMASDSQGFHYHLDPGGINQTAASGSHSHTTDSQGNHDHGGTTWGTSNSHTHSGATDSAGAHYHSAPWTNTGGATVAFTVGVNQGTGYTSTDGAHTHTFTTGGQSADHTHVINVQGAHTHTALGVAAHTHGIYGDGSHTHTVMLGGGGGLFPTIPAVIVVTKIIYAGQQAATAMTVLAAPTLARLAADEDELTAIREELAALRAILAPPRSQRVLSAPSRGPH